MPSGNEEQEEQVEFEDIGEEEESQEEEFDSVTDFETQYIKQPKVGEAIEFTIKGIKKISAEECKFTYIDNKGKQQKATSCLTNVDYGVNIHTINDEVFSVGAWAIWGQIKAICKKLNNLSGKGIKIKIKHLYNGMLQENKDKQCWQVLTEVDGKWKGVHQAKGNDSWVDELDFVQKSKETSPEKSEESKETEGDKPK